MRFIANICHQATTLARVSIDNSPSENLSQNALRAREALTRDANRYRSDRLSDQVLNKLAEIYGDVVASQILSTEARTVTCVVRDGKVHQMEGAVALLTGPLDLVMLIEVWDDKKIAQTEAFLDSIMTPAA